MRIPYKFRQHHVSHTRNQGELTIRDSSYSDLEDLSQKVIASMHLAGFNNCTSHVDVQSIRVFRVL